MADLYRPVALTGNAVVDSLILDGAWNATTLTYGFKSQDIDANGINDFDEGDWKAFYKEIYDGVSSVANLDFVEGDAAQAQLVQRLDVGGGGESGTPSPGITSLETAVGIDPESVEAAADVIRLGTYSETWIHEIGHSLGLGHPHDGENGRLPGVVEPGDVGTGNLNSQIYTVMGYISPFWGEDNPFTPERDENTALNAQPGSFGAIDIAALQHLYGARAHNTGNDVYRFGDDVDANHGYTTIWDTGGSDTIVYDGASSAKIDLRAATLKAEIGGGGWLSTSETLTGGFTIANGVAIEKAKGGSGDDILIGNDGANRLDGAGGADRLSGGLGNDTYVTDGLDIIEEAAGAGADRVLSTVSYRLGTSIENLKLLGTEALDGFGNARANVITGNGGANTLTGGGGNDVLTGGAGDDTFLFRTRPGTGNVDHIRDFSLTDDVVALSAKIFTALGGGTLAESVFKDVASGAVDADDRVLYDHETGILAYDADGSGAGRALTIAVLDTKVALTFADLLVV
ncbi:M10 family metallopeptidase C-terminal domain-containing protein [Methylobacterium sp. 77]|uniref:M10 family metallopeptidase C-terminal domain-containing protein n=1 Tax=Methylobacterium sp. 77 TaxID=1101192 RepID=UPI00036A587E|nr:M10 family metallopeptidase C-terminal domain-containing protein [Methylobacterium sp. 77]